MSRRITRRGGTRGARAVTLLASILIMLTWGTGPAQAGSNDPWSDTRTVHVRNFDTSTCLDARGSG